MYGLSIGSTEAHVVLKANDTNKVDEILTQSGVKTITCEELAKL